MFASDDQNERWFQIFFLAGASGELDHLFWNRRRFCFVKKSSSFSSSTMTIPCGMCGTSNASALLFLAAIMLVRPWQGGLRTQMFNHHFLWCAPRLVKKSRYLRNLPSNLCVSNRSGGGAMRPAISIAQFFSHFAHVGMQTSCTDPCRGKSVAKIPTTSLLHRTCRNNSNKDLA